MLRTLHLARPLSTAADRSVLNSALSTLGVPPAPNASTTTPSTSLSPLTRPSTTNPSQPVLYDIPPAEDPLLAMITNRIQKHGHRTRASRTVSRMLLHIHAFTRAPPLPVLRAAFEKAQPAVKCLLHKQGAKTIAKPVALSEKNRYRYALDWMLKACEKKGGKTLEERLAREVVSVLEGTPETNSVLKEKELAHKFAMVNRGNAQYKTR